MTAATTPHVEATLDTVEIATASPDRPQRYRELGVADDEYLRIREILGRRPTDTELAMYSVMWSEHCSYKSSKVHLRQFGDKAPKSERLLVGMGENAGVVDVGNGIAVTFKIESHNHPSYVEPRGHGVFHQHPRPGHGSAGQNVHPVSPEAFVRNDGRDEEVFDTDQRLRVLGADGHAQ